MCWYFNCVPLFPVPRGLESLIPLNQIIVNAQKDWGDYQNDRAGYYTPNTYKIHNSLGQEIFCANEETSDLNTRASWRTFSMKTNDNLQNEVIYMKRPGCRLAIPCMSALCWGTWFCCLVPFPCINLLELLTNQDCMQEIEVHCTVTFIWIW